jgi:hypothetical protein
MKEKAQRLDQGLHRLLAESDAQSRCAAAVMLCALGKQDEAWPVLGRVASSAGDEKLRETASAALPWLAWEQREALFKQIVAASPGEIDRPLELFNAVPDPRTIEPMWVVLAKQSAAPSLGDIFQHLVDDYGIGGSRYGNTEGVDPKKAVDASVDMLQHGGELQKTAALCLLLSASKVAATQPAADIYNSPANSLALRGDALRVLLLADEAAKAQSVAIAALGAADFRKIALSYLARGADAIPLVHGIYLQRYIQEGRPFLSNFRNGEGVPIAVEVPQGLEPAPLQPLLADGDSETAADAGYLLALLGDRHGLDTLVKVTRGQGWNQSQSTRLVYRAVTKLNDDSQTPLLEEIYQAMKSDRSYELREFYWTIRSMSGPEMLKFRKKMRDEVGMDSLR